MVFDGRTGFLVPKSKLVDYYVDEFIPNWSSGRSLKAITRKTDGEVVKSLVEKASALVEDEELRRRMGRAGRYEIEEGRFSIQTRNNKLKKIFDSCA
jgi:glycosyltransferase involved in cell wall biosynthesis